MAEWWKEALDKWGIALSFSYEVMEASYTGKGLQTGEWFRKQGKWCVQLDPFYTAKINLDSCDESLRCALSVTLKAVYATHAASANQQLCDKFVALSKASGEQLLQALLEPEIIDSLPHEAFGEPGYFVWIRFLRDDEAKRKTGSQTDTLIDEVIDAWTAGGWYTWFFEENGIRSILLYQTFRSMLSMIETEENETLTDVEPVRVYAESVAAMLESDASVAPLVLVSSKLESIHDIYPALAMLVVADHTAKHSSRADRIWFFEDNFLLHWLNLLPSGLGQVLTNWLKFDRKAEKMESLLPEIEEMLDGLVAANLNVSEASRMLYLHRNTLIHRIERIKYLTGLDIRNFVDAVQLWIALKFR